MSLEIKQITTKRGVYRFVKFGNDFYKDCENFCPALILDEMDTFNPKKNFSLKDNKCKAFLCYNHFV